MASDAAKRAQDLIVALSDAVRSLDYENGQLAAFAKRVGEENLTLTDDVHELQTVARGPRLDAVARQCLEMIARYQAEGDQLDSARVLVCLRRALDAMAQAKEAA